MCRTRLIAVPTVSDNAQHGLQRFGRRARPPAVDAGQDQLHLRIGHLDGDRHHGCDCRRHCGLRRRETPFQILHCRLQLRVLGVGLGKLSFNFDELRGEVPDMSTEFNRLCLCGHRLTKL